MLKARLDDFFKKLFLNNDKLLQLEKKYCSPLNVLFPNNFCKNIDRFKSVLDKYDLRYEIFYAHKSNKSKVFLKNAYKYWIWIDVASIHELNNAIDVWFSNSKIEATWPKSRIFLEKLLIENVLINIDSFSELDEILSIKKEKNIIEKTCIIIRISWFTNSKISRFWIELSKTKLLLEFVVNNRDNFNLEWFSFHIDSVSSIEKASALEEIFLLQNDFSRAWFFTRKINIGWWFRLSYIEDSGAWEKYYELLKKELVDENLLMTWKKSSYWFNIVNDKVIWESNIYLPYSKNTSELFLEEILNYELKNFWNIKICEYLKDNLIKLQIEPWRSLHDLTWFTLSKVIWVKEMSWENLIILDINSFSIWSREQELFVDPIIISKDKKVTTNSWVFFTWNLCLESDFVYRHKSFLWIIPQVWDLVIFPNTSWYFMDFYENTAILQEVAKKIVIDENYNTILEDNYI